MLDLLDFRYSQPNLIAMKLISLDITNFRVIKKARIDFPEKVIGIIGPNGAGKSSIIEAISYALYGNQTARTGKDEIKGTYAQPVEDCRVELEFLINEGKYKVIRKLIGKSERAEVELYYNDATESVGVNETKNYVGELLGLDWRGFLSSFLARQSELNALSDLTPSKRRDHIAGMLGIERLDKAIENTKKDSRLFKDRFSLLEEILSKKDVTTNRINDLIGEQKKLTPLLEAAEIAFKKTQDNLKRETERYEKVQTEKDNYLRLNGQLESEQKTLISINDRIEKLSAEKTELLDLKKQADQLEALLVKLPQLKARLELLKDIRNRAEDLKRLQTEHNQLSGDLEGLKKKIDQLLANEKNLNDQLVKYSENLNSEQSQKKEEIEQLRDDYSQLKAKVQTIYNERKRISDQLKSVGELGSDSVCDRCLRPMGDDFEKITEHLKKDLADYNQQYVAAENQLLETEANGKKLAEQLKLIEQGLTKRNELLSNLEKIASELELNREYRNNQEERRLKLEAQISNIRVEAYEPEEIGRLETEYTRLLDKKTEYDRMTGRIKRYEAVITDIESLTKLQTETSLKINKLSEAVKATNYSEAQFEQVKSTFVKSQQFFEEGKDEYLGFSRQLELIEQELRLKKEQEISFEKTAFELEQARDDHFHLEKLGNLFSDYRKELIASIRPTLADMSSKLLNEMTDGRYCLVELDEKYNLRVHDNGQFFGVDRFSGGEKDLANLCLRLAISQALTDSAGLDSSFVILDEVFGSQDSERKELILSALANLKSRFPQILLISHIEDVKNGVEELIEVRPTGLGWSEVFVNEQKV